ncbi:MAG: hypothetical protein EOP24_25905 [Hyphomicrobiales bacterium]|nr:MAG: hypothetical protein EOP24_25905 [Hyphomicrobiales bacterium]
MKHRIHFSRNSGLPKAAAERLRFETVFVGTIPPDERARPGTGQVTDNPTYESLEALAFVCGFDSYADLSKDKNDESRPPSPLDEDLSPEQLEERRAYQAQRLQDWFDRQAPGFGRRLDWSELIGRWQPTARRWSEDATFSVAGHENAFVQACERLVSTGTASDRHLYALKAGLRHGAEKLLPGSLKLIRTACIALESSRDGERKRLAYELLESLSANGDALARAYYAKRLNDCGDYQSALIHAHGRPSDELLTPQLRAVLSVQEARALLSAAYQDQSSSVREEMSAQKRTVLQNRSARELRRARETLSGLSADHFETPEATGEWLTWLTVADFVCSRTPEGLQAHIAKVIPRFQEAAETYGNIHARKFYADLMKKQASFAGQEEQQ